MLMVMQGMLSVALASAMPMPSLGELQGAPSAVWIPQGPLKMMVHGVDKHLVASTSHHGMGIGEARLAWEA